MGPQPWFGSAVGGLEAGYHIASTHSHAITSVALMLSVSSRVNAASASLARTAVTTAAPLAQPIPPADAVWAGRHPNLASSRSDVIGIAGLPGFGIAAPASRGLAVGFVVEIPVVVAPVVVGIIRIVRLVPRPRFAATLNCRRGPGPVEFPGTAGALVTRQTRRLPPSADASFCTALPVAVEGAADDAEYEEPEGR